MSNDRDRSEIGRRAEERAVRWLKREGYRIVARNYVTPSGEIDVIAYEGETLCFLEIKARRTATYGLGAEAVGPAKQRRYLKAATWYLASLARRGAPSEPPCRFDVLSLDPGSGGETIRLFRDAFEAF